MSISNELVKVRSIIQTLDVGEKWVDMTSKDVPVEVCAWVADQLTQRNVDDVRKALGMTSPTDVRWRKIMTALRTGKRVDATAIFLKWLHRNERLGDRVDTLVSQILSEEKPLSKLSLEGIRMIADLQVSTVKLGKELGVFADPYEASKGQGGVTIVVQTNVPRPDPKVIVAHQEARAKKHQAILKQYEHSKKEDDVDSGGQG